MKRNYVVINRRFFTWESNANINSDIDVIWEFPKETNYKFCKADLEFSLSNSRSIDLSVSGATVSAKMYSSYVQCNTLSIVDDGNNWLIEKDDKLRLKIANATGSINWKIYSEEV